MEAIQLLQQGLSVPETVNQVRQEKQAKLLTLTKALPTLIQDIKAKTYSLAQGYPQSFTTVSKEGKEVTYPVGIINDMLLINFSFDNREISGKDIVELEIARQAKRIQPEVNITAANAVGNESAQILSILFTKKYGHLHIHEFWNAFNLALLGEFEVDLNFYQSFNFLNVSRVMDAYLAYRSKILGEVNKFVEAETKYNQALAEYNEVVELDNELTRRNITEIYNYLLGQTKKNEYWTRIKGAKYSEFVPDAEKEKATFIHETSHLLEWLGKRGRYIQSPEFDKNVAFFESLEADELKFNLEVNGFDGKVLDALVAEQLPKFNKKAKTQAMEIELVELIRSYVKIGATATECISDLFNGEYPICPIAKAKFEATPEYRNYFEIVRLKANLKQLI